MNPLDMMDNAHKAGDAQVSGALFSAAQRGDVDRVAALLAAADIREITVQEEMHGALRIAIRNDFPAVVRVLCAAGVHFGLATHGVRVSVSFPMVGNEAYIGGFRPIHLAASVGSASCIAELVSHFQVAARSRDLCWDAPLHWACRFAHADAVRQLLASKADVGDRNANGDTPLNVAVLHKHIRCVKVLVASQLEEAVLQSAIRRHQSSNTECSKVLQSAIRRHQSSNTGCSKNHRRVIIGLLERALRLHEAKTVE